MGLERCGGAFVPRFSKDSWQTLTSPRDLPSIFEGSIGGESEKKRVYQYCQQRINLWPEATLFIPQS